MNALIVGGTRNLGPSLVRRFLESGYHVSVFNRGQTPSNLPKEVERLLGDRTIAGQLHSAVNGRDFDVVVDTTLYTGKEAEAATQIFAGRVGRYVFISTGQVYLVREGLKKPYNEEDYAGPIMPEPSAQDRYDHENWLYGMGKREAEDVFLRAWQERRFPFISLRLPMVHSERDHYHRIEGYLLRLKDGGQILLPEGEDPQLRHVYAEDVISAAERAIASDTFFGHAYNISQNEICTLREFLKMLAPIAGLPLRIQSVPRSLLKKHQLIPDCSPFSGAWMSLLENRRSIEELGMDYTPLAVYLERLVASYNLHPDSKIPGYRRRSLELQLAQENF